MSLERFPVRRDPRPLVLVEHAGVIQYAVLDAWEIRGVGILDATTPTLLRLALARLVLQTRPSAIVVAKPRVGQKIRTALRVLGTIASHSGIPIISLAGDVLKDVLEELPDDPRDTYPELRGIDLPLPDHAIQIAIGVLANQALPPRKYAPTITAQTPPGVGSKRLQGARAASLPHGSADHRSLGRTRGRGRSHARRSRARTPRHKTPPDANT